MVYLKNVSKKFFIKTAPQKSALGYFVFKVIRREQKKEIQVLDKVSFECKNGEVMGIIGRNGSGKSTLLKIIAGIYKADEGELSVTGEILYLSGFYFGIRDKLTMRENIYLKGTLMGFTKKEIDNCFNEIVEFSGLRDFLDTKVYQFSSGMIARFSFSSVVGFLEYRQPKIVLLDEVLESGGDEEFKQKALRKIEKFINSGATVLLVTHNMNYVRKYCTSALLLEKGKVVFCGETAQAEKEYKKLLEKADLV